MPGPLHPASIQQRWPTDFTLLLSDAYDL